VRSQCAILGSACASVEARTRTKRSGSPYGESNRTIAGLTSGQKTGLFT
jgi:hypothetical protein